MQITAAVARERFGAFSVEQVELTDPRPDELLVKIVASGMCQTDQHGRDGYYDTPLPAVFGHEGAGVVAAVGSGVTGFKPGDHVVMSFPWCGACANCRREMHAHCQKSFDLKMNGTRADGSTLISQNGAPIYSAFFQQSSFATHAIANQRFAVRVRGDAPLELLGPFACSGQTGAGAVFNSMQPRPGDSFAVFGVGAVGLSGLMAAKIAGCDPIIAVDVHDKRLALARELGATHAINHSGRNDVVSEIRSITGGGVRFSLETSALPQVLRRIAEMSDAAGLPVANVFHAGDGNMHPLIIFDANRPGDLERVEALGADILRLCVEVGGCLTGEHGVGIEKRELMRFQYAQAHELVPATAQQVMAA